MWHTAIFFFNDTATTEIYTLSLHDALPISFRLRRALQTNGSESAKRHLRRLARSEEHTSELQSQSNLVCRLLLEKKNTTDTASHSPCQDVPFLCRADSSCVLHCDLHTVSYP